MNEGARQTVVSEAVRADDLQYICHDRNSENDDYRATLIQRYVCYNTKYMVLYPENVIIERWFRTNKIGRFMVDL